MAAPNPKPSRELLRELAFKRAHYLLSKHRLAEREVYDFVREFFKEYLDIRYEFTLDELLTELNRVYLEAALKERIRAFIGSLRFIEYTDTQLGHEALKAQVAQFLDLVKILVPPRQPARHPWHRRLHRWLTRRGVVEEVESFVLQSPKESQVFPTEEAALKQLDRDRDARRAGAAAHATPKIEALLTRAAQDLSTRRFDEARAAYAELAAHYETLDEDAKTLYYDQVHFLFEELMRHPGSAVSAPTPRHAVSLPRGFWARPVAARKTEEPAAKPSKWAVPAPAPAPEPASSPSPPPKPVDLTPMVWTGEELRPKEKPADEKPAKERPTPKAEGAEAWAEWGED